MFDFTDAAECTDCGSPAGVACLPGCSVWASDDIPLVDGFDSALALEFFGIVPVPVISDDPWFVVGADSAPEPF